MVKSDLFTTSRDELKKVAAAGGLLWEGKKVVLDPFTEVDYSFEVFEEGERYRLRCVSGGEAVTPAMVFPLGLLRYQLFRFWKEGAPEPLPETVSRGELKKIVDDQIPLTWRCDPPQWNPDPLPFLVLKDRTGGFAELWFDYGTLGHSLYTGTEAERGWERDLLETDFVRRAPGYYCPLDKVVKSLTFLLEIGWTVIDFTGKKVVRQGDATLTSALEHNRLMVRGAVTYGSHRANISDVVGAFNRRDRFVMLSDQTVGLIDVPPAWEPFTECKVSHDGIEVKRSHYGVLDEVVPLPPDYRVAEWEQVVPGPDFHGVLFPYQQTGVDWLSYLYRSGFSGLLADEMGLGKTVQLLAFLSTVRCEKPILIVMPVSLIFHWKKEIERFFPKAHVEVVSYAQLRAQRMRYESNEYEMVILDEAQAIKNPDTLTAQIVCRLKAPFKLAITGTPVENRYRDLWSIFRFLMPDLLGDQKESPVFERVRKKIGPFTLRRTKGEVDLQLPEKEEQTVWVSVDEAQQQFYDTYLQQRKRHLLEEGLVAQRMEILELILRLRQICCHPRLVGGEVPSAKFERVCDDLLEVVASGHKVILYSQFTSVLGLFRQWLREQAIPFAYLDGETQHREQQVEAFQTDPSIQIFLISLKAGGVGLNLQAADYVFLYDPWWNTAVEKQAIDRAHRVGRQGRVIARKYLVAESIEEKILKLQHHKSALSSQLLEFEGEDHPVTLEELYGLLEIGFNGVDKSLSGN